MSSKPIVVTVERDLQDLIPIFLAQRQADQTAIAAALPLRHFDALRKVGHGMAGAGTGYGFPQITDLGERIVAAAHAGDIHALEKLKGEYDDFMLRLVVNYL